MKKPVLIFVHGFKKQNKNDFDFFIEQKKLELKEYELVVIDYYDSNDKKTIDENLFNQKMKNCYEKYKSRKVLVISYSFGCILSLINSKDYENINKFYLFMPTLFISRSNWINKFKEMKIKEKKLKKKLGKERFLNLKSKISSKYVIKVAILIDKYLNKNRDKLKDIKDKEIFVLYSEKDLISSSSKTIPFLKQNLELNNKIEFNEVDESHFGVLDKEKYMNELVNYIKKLSV